MKGLFKVNWANIKSAFIYGLLSMVVIFLWSVGESIKAHGSIYGIDWKAVIDTGSMAALGVFVALVSVLKNLLTTAAGKFLGIIEVIPDKDYNSK